jgi:ribosomal protein L37AE/L43A
MRDKETKFQTDPNCDMCGRLKNRHTNEQVNKCKSKMKDGVTPVTKVSHVTSEYMQTTFRAYNDKNQGWKR